MKKEKSWVSIIDRVIIVLFIVGMLVPSIYAVIGNAIRPVDFEDTSYGEITELSGEWTWIKEDGTCEVVQLPGQIAANKGELVTLERTLPDDVEDNLYLCVASSKQDMDIYIDDNLRISYSTKDTRFWGNTSSFRLLFVKMSHNDAGKTIRIQAKTEGFYAGTFPYMYIGERTAIWIKLALEHGIEALVATIMLGVFCAMFMVCIVLSAHYKKIINLLYVAIMGIFSMVWVFCNSRIRQLYLYNVSIGNDLAYLMVMVLPITVILYMDSVQKKKYRGVYRIMSILVVINIVVSPILQVLRIKDLSETFVVSAGLFVITFLLACATIIKDIMNKSAYSYAPAAMGIIAGGIVSMIQFAMYAFDVIGFNGINVALIMIVVGFAATYNTFLELRRVEMERSEIVAQGKAESTFLANMSHEIRTPINAILGMDELILRGDIDDETREYAMDIQAAGQTLLVIVNDVLDESRIRSGRMEIVPVNYSLSRMVREILAMFSMKAQDKGLKLELEMDDKLPDGYFGDDVRIKQILNNLVSNAIKYTDVGLVKLSISGSRDGDNEILHIAVTDTGIGVKEEDQDKLFSAFGRVDLKHNRNIEGTGLGLAITASLLTMMGSKLQFKSAYGVGSQFYFDLKQPVVDETSVAIARERGIAHISEKERILSEYIAPDAQVLVADDNMLNLKVFCKLLATLQMNIDTAADGLEALGKTRVKKYDLIFMDHMMPVMDGVEVLHDMREDMENPNRETTTIALTANAIGDAKERYASEGFDGFLAKPFIPAKLEEMILALLPEEKLLPGVEDYSHNSIDSREDVNIKEDYTSNDSEIEISGMGELPVISGIDWEEATRNLPERSILDSIVEEFYTGAVGEIETVKRLYETLRMDETDEAREEYRIRVHALKNSAALIGGMKVSEQAKKLEFASRDGDLETIYQGNDTFCLEYMSLAERLAQAWGGSIELVSRQVASADEIRAQIDELIRAFDADDISAMNDAMETLESYEYSGEIKNHILTLSESVLEMNRTKFDSVVKLILEAL